MVTQISNIMPDIDAVLTTAGDNAPPLIITAPAPEPIPLVGTNGNGARRENRPRAGPSAAQAHHHGDRRSRRQADRERQQLPSERRPLEGTQGQSPFP